MKAVVLAAGQGVRLKPLTNTRPKVMLQVAGKPLLHHLLLELKKAKITEVVIVVRYMKEKIIDYFKTVDLGMKITFVEQGENNGTGAALLAAENKIDDDFIVLAGDMVTESGAIKDVIQAHEKGVTLALKHVSKPQGYGVAHVTNGKVTSFEEKPTKPKSDLANISIYGMGRDVFDQVRKLKPSIRGEYELTDLLVGARAVITGRFWLDVGYPWHLFAANEWLLGKMDARNEAVENSTINGRVIMENGARVFDSYVEGTCYIGEGSIIGPHACIKGATSIGRNCEIGDSTTVKNSILFDGVKAKHLSYIGDSVIGDNANFGAGTQVANYRFDEKNVLVIAERGWVNTGRKKLGAIVGDNVKFGVLSCTMPGKLIGENCWIGSGVTVNQNIEPDTHVFVEQKLILAKRK